MRSPVTLPYAGRVHVSRWRRIPAALLVLAGCLPAQKAAEDTYLPWEGGSAYYAKWPQGPSSEADFFPISVWLQSPENAARYRAIGINQFIGLWKGPTAEQLAGLASAGMPVLATYSGRSAQIADTHMIRGWILMDEPDNGQDKPGGGWGPCILPPVIVEQYRMIRAAAGTRPVLLNLGQAVINEEWPGRGEACGGHYEHYPEYIRGGDIVSYDVYPVNENLPLWYVGAGVDRLREWADYKKPVWNWIETTAIQGVRGPTPAQVKSEVWMSLIHGSMGIGYFCHRFKPKEAEAGLLEDSGMRQAVGEVNAQIRSLARVLNTPSVGNGVTVSSSHADVPVETMLKRYERSSYLFAIGGRPGETTATFRLRGCGSSKVRVLGESRSLTMSGGGFQDRFRDYEVHLYEIPCSGNGR